MPLVQTRGAASAQGFGEFSQPAGPVNWIDDVFSTWVYTGNGGTQTITNGIDLSTKGGLVWLKSRSQAYWNNLTDTARGAGFNLWSNDTAASTSISNGLTAFNANGFTLGSYANTNQTSETFVSWAFREQPKFFDIVTYTGNGVTTGRTISHNLGSAPGMIILKVTNLAGDDWYVYHRSIPTRVLALNSQNSTNPTTPANVFGNGTTVVAPTSTEFTIGSVVNPNTYTYVAYLFAHDAGGFGTAGTDNVVSCGSFNTDGSGNATVSLGYEPQYLMFKRTDSAGNWNVVDVMRGFSLTNNQLLQPNRDIAEFSANWGNPTATGFTFDEGNLSPSATFIYMAIRRPMKPPTVGTTVFGLNAITGTGANATVTGSAGVSDAVLIKNRGSAVASLFSSRLTGTGYLVTSTTAAEVAAGATILQANPWDVMDGVNVGTTSTITNATSNTYINYLFRRAAGFFDEVCYSGNSTAGATQAHNLGVAPELMIVKKRDSATNWAAYHSALGNTKWVTLNADNPASTASTVWNNTTPTASVFTVGSSTTVNGSAATYVAYLFATCPGVSKVGSYTGTGATQTINCGFTGGARFVLIRRTDDWDGGNPSGPWYVWDTARGMVSGTDPSLLLNSTAAEVNANSVYTASTGFQIVSTAAGINASGGTYIFLAVS